MMDTNGSDHDDAPRRPAGDESAAADNWLDDLLNPGAAEPDKEDAHPTEPGTVPAPDGQRNEAVAPPQEIDPPFIGRYQVIRPLGQGGFGRSVPGATAIFAVRSPSRFRSAARATPSWISSST